MARRAWTHYRAEALARGVKLTFADYLPPPVSPEDNYVTGTIFEHAPLEKPSHEYTSPLKLAAPVKGPRLKMRTGKERLAWAQASVTEAGWLKDAPSEPARTVLLGLDRFQTELRELRDVRTRPAADLPHRLPPPESGSQSWTLARDAALLWIFRMDAHLAVGEPDEALEDFRDGLRVYQALAAEPTLIAGLTRLSVLTGLISAVDGGLLDRRWRPEDLPKIEEALGKIDVLADFRRAFSSERGWINDTLEWIRHASWHEQTGYLKSMDWASRQEPLGWKMWYQLPVTATWRQQVTENQLLDRRLAELEGGFDGALAVVLASRREEGEPLSSLTQDTVQRYVAAEMGRRETRLVCALERFHLERSIYPEALGELAPAFIDRIPTDVIDGQPIRYHRTQPELFVVYSIGANARDDGGSAKFDQKMLVIYKAEDWVWGQPWK